MSNKLLRRCNKIAFYSIKEDAVTTYYRMRGFTDFTVSKNASEYSRKYVDESFEQSDVVGYSPSVSFSFDYIMDNKVHNDIAEISKKELVGDDIVRSIVIVDTTSKDSNGKYRAVKRDFSVIVDTEGNGTETYQISGNFKAKSMSVCGLVSTEDDFETCTFVTDVNDDGAPDNAVVIVPDEDEL
ncbi:MAG: hypothetical protein E7404_05740 [Ruminococcaceae bacterium]|nr:hypothetical protein [Oscillospiraceae bacterium]